MFGVTTARGAKGESTARAKVERQNSPSTSATRRDRLAGDLVFPASRCRRQPNKDTEIPTRHLYTTEWDRRSLQSRGGDIDFQYPAGTTISNRRVLHERVLFRAA